MTSGAYGDHPEQQVGGGVPTYGAPLVPGPAGAGYQNSYGSYPAAAPVGPPPYPQPGYPSAPFQQPPPGYGYPPAGGYPPPRNGMGTAGLVLGIIGLVFCWASWVGWVLNVLAIIFGGVGIGRANHGQATNKGSAVAGLVLGLVGLVLGILLWVAVGITLFGLSRV
jgi:hypothetical protein